MSLWLVMTALTPAAAAPLAPGLAPIVSAIEAPAPRSAVNLRLVRQPAFEPERVRRSGIIVETSIAPNAAIGVGLVKLRKQAVGAFEPKSETRKPSSRKVGLSFRFQF